VSTRKRPWPPNSLGRLRKAGLDGRLGRLHILAAPRFLGHLRRQLDEATRDLVKSETAKDLSRLDAGEIRTLLPDYL
jgi:protein required for attachment to host cells